MRGQDIQPLARTRRATQRLCAHDASEYFKDQVVCQAIPHVWPIRTTGRWSSDLHRLYMRVCFEQCKEWSRRAGSTAVSDLAGTFDEVDFY